MSRRPVIGKLDIGAFEFVPPSDQTLVEQINALLIQLDTLLDQLTALKATGSYWGPYWGKP